MARRPDPLAVREKVVSVPNKEKPMGSIVLKFNGNVIRDAGQSLNLTDMWKAAGSDKAKQPANWLASSQAREFIDFVGDMQTPRNSGSLVETKEGRGGGTWAHWQIAMAYAKYLSPAFHAWCNDVVRAHMQGQSVAQGAGVSLAEVAGLIARALSDALTPVVEVQRKMLDDMNQLQAQVIALHRDHNNARDMSAIGNVCAKTRIKAPIVRIAKEKARYLGGKKAEGSFNRKFHIRLREACGGFAGPWDRLPRDLLGAAETCVANIEREVRADTLIAERQGGYTAQQLRIDERNQRPN